tara:strand:+ start:922 stop:1056 length:135 start_codon:yes stop_codon:yes gene_type:complete
MNEDKSAAAAKHVTFAGELTPTSLTIRIINVAAPFEVWCLRRSL